MERLNRAALITTLIEKLRDHGSWCGETHIQKNTYFLQELMKVPLGFEFILYKHGPFSFDLRDELTSLRADELITLEPQWPYGPRIITTSQSDYIQKNHSNIVQKYSKEIALVAQKFGDKNVAELERLATAYFVTQDSGIGSVEKRAEIITELKPHITTESAKESILEIDEIIEQI